MKKIIHLNALRALEASARHQSFSAAAEELNVTPAAVGQLVRTLENWVSTPLFHRKTSGKVRLVPTKTAELALADIRAGLDKLALGLEQLQAGSNSGVLTVTVSAAFAAKWLLPRIDRFQSIWSDIDVRLDTSTKSVDFAAQEVDIGVRYGAGQWTGLVAEKLMEEEVYPVCSPQLLQDKVLLDLTRETLIHDRSMDGYIGLPSWDDWLEQAGLAKIALTDRDLTKTDLAKTDLTKTDLTKTDLTKVDTSRGMQINNSAAVQQAVINGHGVALARSVMAQDDLAAGRLVWLFPEINFTSTLAYYVVYRPECANMPKLTAFRDWLFEEASVDERFI